MTNVTRLVVAALLVAAPALAQTPPAAPPAGPPGGGRQGGFPGRGPYVPSGSGRTNNPFPDPINTTDGVIKIGLAEFATITDAGSDPARVNLLIDEPGTRRMFVNTMTGMLYSVSYDGNTVAPYLDI